MNSAIRAREVRLIDADGKQLGIMPLREALRIAGERELDLCEVAPTANPPVCRVMDYGKFRYEQSKKEREAKKRQKAITIKEIRMTPKTEVHDLQVKAKNALRFLEQGDKVKVSVRFRGREIVHQDLVQRRLIELAGQLESVGTVERPPKVEGRHMIMILAPKKSG